MSEPENALGSSSQQEDGDDSNPLVNDESSDAAVFGEDNSQDQVDEYSDENDDSIDIHDEPIYENDNAVSLSMPSNEDEESSEVTNPVMEQDMISTSESSRHERLNSLHSEPEPNSFIEEDNTADESMHEDLDSQEHQEQDVNNIEIEHSEGADDTEDAQSESLTNFEIAHSESLEYEHNEDNVDAEEVQGEEIDDVEDETSENIGDADMGPGEEDDQVEDADVSFEEERHEIELDEPSQTESHVIEVDNAEDDQSGGEDDVVEIDGGEDSNLQDKEENQSALQGSVDDESEETSSSAVINETPEVTNGNDASTKSPEAQTDSTKSDEAKTDSEKKDKEEASSEKKTTNEEEEEYIDPLLEGAVVDLTEETDEPTSSSAQSSNATTSQDGGDNDDIVVLLEKKDPKKKKDLTPVPIFVKVNSNQKEKIITDSVDLMCLIQCSICKKNRREIRGHVRTAHKLEFEKYKQLHGETMHFSRLTYHRCKICSKLIVYEFWNFRNHLRRAHSMDTVRYSLKYLEQKKKQPPEKPQKQKRQVQRRQPRQQQQPQLQNLAPQPQSFTNVVSEMCKFQCKICMQSFSFLPEHVKNHHSLGFPQYKEMFGNELKLTTVTYHQCNICQKTLRFDRPTLQKHLGVVHKAKLGAYMKHYLVKKGTGSVDGEEIPPPTVPASQNNVKSLGSFKVSSSLTITKVRSSEDGTSPAPTPSTSHVPSFRGRPPMFGGRGGGRGGGRYNLGGGADDPKIFTDNPDDMCLTMCRLCGSELKPKSLSNHLINQHQSNLVRYKAEFGREIVFTKLRYHKCKVCGKTLKFESKQLCYHLTSVHSMSFTQYKEKYLYREGVLIKKRHRGGGKHSFIQRHAAAAANGALNPAAAAALWSAGLISAGVEPAVAHVLPDLYTQPPSVMGMGDIGVDMDVSDDAESNHYVPGYDSMSGGMDDDMVGHHLDDGEGIDPLQCLSVSIDQNGKNEDAGGYMDDMVEGGYSESSNNDEVAQHADVVQPESIIHDSEDSILPDLDVDITENPIKIEPEVAITDS